MIARPGEAPAWSANMKRLSTTVAAWAAAVGAALAPAAPPGQEIWPMPAWQKAAPERLGMDAEQLAKARDYALTGGGSGCIVRDGRLVLAWGPQTRRYDLKSTTKSIGLTAVGLALADGKLQALRDKAGRYHPHFRPGPKDKRRRREKITLLHLATQTAGFAKPGGSEKLLFEPGTKWCYSDSGPNWLAECVTLAYSRDVKDLLFERVFTPLGIAARDLTWRRNAYRPARIAGIPRREFGSGISANVSAMARIGLLYLRGGRWGRRQILPKDFVEAVGRTPQAVKGLPVVGKIGAKPPASNHYGLLWWNNNDDAIAGVPRDAYWSWGLYDSFIVVIPSLDLVAARAGKSWQRKGTDYDALAAFLQPVVASVKGAKGPAGPAAKASEAASSARPAGAYPPSPVITAVSWAPKSTIIRKAAGSDNWPMTWGDDDALYTAYGDGWGFKPKVKPKLSLGLARIVGDPPDLRAANLRSPSAEKTGDGPRGPKACGMLMVRGVLYMWVRNANRRGQQSQLARSKDRGRTWTWCDWKFPELGYPCFLNFGPNYAGARDEYAYVYSPDTPSAYAAADRVVLARVRAGQITDRGAYEFLVGLNDGGEPIWSQDIARRGAAFRYAGGCNRMAVTYNAPLKRYLMTMRSRGRASRGADHFSIYDAPEPWGPWTTVFRTSKWDVDPGEAQHIPAKWIGPDGRSLYLVFSGSDSFSIRRAALTVSRR